MTAPCPGALPVSALSNMPGVVAQKVYITFHCRELGRGPEPLGACAGLPPWRLP